MGLQKLDVLIEENGLLLKKQKLSIINEFIAIGLMIFCLIGNLLFKEPILDFILFCTLIIFVMQNVRFSVYNMKFSSNKDTIDRLLWELSLSVSCKNN